MLKNGHRMAGNPAQTVKLCGYHEKLMLRQSYVNKPTRNLASWFEVETGMACELPTLTQSTHT